MDREKLKAKSQLVKKLENLAEDVDSLKKVRVKAGNGSASFTSWAFISVTESTFKELPEVAICLEIAVTAVNAMRDKIAELIEARMEKLSKELGS